MQKNLKEAVGNWEVVVDAIQLIEYTDEGRQFHFDSFVMNESEDLFPIFNFTWE